MNQLFLRTAAASLAFLCAMAWCSPKGGFMAISVTSRAFDSMQAIPAAYTCDGTNASPPVSWSGVPKNANSIVLICDDPDAPAGTWVHWVCYDIPPHVDSLVQAVPPSGALVCGGKQGTNDFRSIGYGGPCPPGGTHRYFFKVYALDIVLGLPAGKGKRDIEKAMKGHVMASGELVGTYSRKR